MAWKRIRLTFERERVLVVRRETLIQVGCEKCVALARFAQAEEMHVETDSCTPISPPGAACTPSSEADDISILGRLRAFLRR